MPGFFVSNQNTDIELVNLYPGRCAAGELHLSRGTARRNTLNQFVRDKAFAESEDTVTVLDGVLLNKTELFQRYGTDTVEALMLRMYRSGGDEFFAEFRGEFSGALYDRRQDKWLVFTSHSGANPIFYTKDERRFFAGSQVNYVIDACREAGVVLHMDETAAYQMLTYGFMIDDATYAKEIRRLRGGTYLICCGDRTEVCTYHTYAKNPHRFAGYTEAQIIDELDAAFRRAVAMEYEKDREYGYRHIADISGGLDARMSLWAAHEMGCGPVQLKTYGRAGCPDEQISKAIARYWKDELLIKPLDDASFLYDIEENVFMTGGLSFYSGITGGNRLLKTIRTEAYGLEHTGLFGGEVLSSWYITPADAEKHSPTGCFSSGTLLPRLAETRQKMEEHFGDHELFLWYTRGFQGAANTCLIRRNYLEPCSAYMNVEFAQLCMDIPVEQRMHHRIHKKWILAKYPDAARFKWEKTGAAITESALSVGWKRILFRGSNKLIRLLLGEAAVPCGMNPMDYWLARDEKLRSYLDDYARQAFENMPVCLSGELERDMKEQYRRGNAIEKSMVLTVLSAMKLYFGKV